MAGANNKAATRAILWMVIADLPIILIPTALYLRTKSYPLMFIPLPLGMVVNFLILRSQRSKIARKTDA